MSASPHYLAAALVVSAGLPLSTHGAETTDDVQRLPETVVTATKSVKDTSDAPASASVVTKNEIELANVQSTDEALQFLPGVYATRPGGHEPSVMGTNVLLRGIPDYSRTLVLVDGQTLNDPYIGAVTWESVPPETIERIEVVRGPFSALYGGSAMGGVINIITRVPTEQSISIKAGAGSYNFQNASVVYQDRLGKGAGIVLDYDYKRSDGYIKDEVFNLPGSTPTTTLGTVTGAQKTTDAQGNVRYLIGDKGPVGWDSQNIGAKVYLNTSDTSRLSFGISQFTYSSFGRNHFDTYLRDAGGNPVSNGNYTLSEYGVNVTIREKDFLTGPDTDIKTVYRYTMEYDNTLSASSTLKALLGYVDLPLYNDYIVPAGTATLSGGGGTRMLRPNKEASGSVQINTAVSEQQHLVTGVSISQRSIETVTYSISDWRDPDATGPIVSQTAGQDQTYAAFVQDEIALTNRLTAYLGGRYDYWTTDGFVEVGGIRSVYGERDQSFASPKASLVYRPDERTTFRTSAGNAFHAPMLRDTFGYWTPTTGYTFNPNPDLKPETVTSWEAGAERKLGSGTLLRATYYDNTLKNLIYRTSDSVTKTESVANAGQARVKGVEIEARHQLTKRVDSFVNATFNDPRIVANSAKPATEGKVMTATPREAINLGLQGASGPWSGSLLGQHVGKVYANDQNLDIVSGVYGSYDPYTIVNAKLGYALTKNGKLSLAVDNLLDRQYYQGSRAMGRAFYGEIAWRW